MEGSSGLEPEGRPDSRLGVTTVQVYISIVPYRCSGRAFVPVKLCMLLCHYVDKEAMYHLQLHSMEEM
jgi:hypothetical protein